MLLNSMLAPNPAARLVMTLLYKTPVAGLNTLWFGEEYSLLKQFDLNKLASPDLPHIYINSYNLETHRSDIYTNHPQGRPIKAAPITMPALCASSALPYILSPVEVDGQTHIEGALVDSFCFEAVHECHDDINEIWVSRIVDHQQVREPANLLDALNNLIMLYAGTTSRNDIELFAHHINHEELMDCHASRRKADPIEVLQLPVETSTTYLWSYENLDNSVRRSKESCLRFIENYCATLKNGQRVPRMHNVFPRHGSQFHAPDGSIAPAYRAAGAAATRTAAKTTAAKKPAPKKSARNKAVAVG
jgi:predicted acylesterase/phospholipase RssA